MPAHKIDFYLNSSDQLRALAREARRVAELQRAFLQIAPQPLTQACCVKQLRAGTLFLLAGNAAVASKLEQLAPRLLTAYEKQGFEITAIRVEVQVKEAPYAITQCFENKQLSDGTVEHLELLATNLEDSPLKQAVTKMAARHRAYQAHSKH